MVIVGQSFFCWGDLTVELPGDGKGNVTVRVRSMEALLGEHNIVAWGKKIMLSEDSSLVTLGAFIIFDISTRENLSDV